MSSPGSLATVRILDFPVAVWDASRQHLDGLRREFSLLAKDRRRSDAVPAHAPAALVALIDDFDESFGGYANEQENEMFFAVERGDEIIDELVYSVPFEVVAGLQHMRELLDGADDYCRNGEHLLTMGAPAVLTHFRHWFFEQFKEQFDGAAPTSWPDYLAAYTAGDTPATS